MKWFEIPEKFIPKLRELQDADKEYGGETVQKEDAIVMTLGLGDPMFLTFDGRIIIEDMLNENPPRDAARMFEATTALVIGARKRKMPELLEMLPARPDVSIDCPNCKEGWRERDGIGDFVCQECGGLGWTAIELSDSDHNAR